MRKALVWWNYFIQWYLLLHQSHFYMRLRQVNLDHGQDRGGRKREREKWIKIVIDWVCWRKKMVWVGKMTIGRNMRNVWQIILSKTNNVNQLGRDTNSYFGLIISFRLFLRCDFRSSLQQAEIPHYARLKFKSILVKDPQNSQFRFSPQLLAN